MKHEPLRQDAGYSMPAHRPYYPPLPTYYRDVRFQIVFFSADPAQVRSIVPEPLEPAADGLCAAFTVDVPFSSDYGPFQESGLLERVLFRGAAGFYCSHVFLNNVRAIVSGRERWGTPKVYADVRLAQHGDSLLSVTAMDGIEVMTVRSHLGKPASPQAMMPIFPAYRLKIIPRADGPGFALKQLVTAAPTEATTHLFYEGAGAVAFHPAASEDLAALRPLSPGPAFYQVASYTESYGEVVYTYPQSGE
jgi:acetoacetate decarboxylase